MKKNKNLIVLSLLSLGIFAVSCNQTSKNEYSTERVKEATHENWQDLKSEFNKKIDAAEEKIDELNNQAADLKDESKDEYQQQIANLKSAKEKLKDNLKQLKEDTGESFDDVKDEISEEYARLENNINNLYEKLTTN